MSSIRSHNRLSAFGVIGTKEQFALFVNAGLSQSPFGFWGDWNRHYPCDPRGTEVLVTIAFRLLG